MSRSGNHRHGAERRELLLDWFRSCESLRDALLMPVGAIPRHWPEKLRLAQQAQTLLVQVIDEWSLRPQAAGDEHGAGAFADPLAPNRG